MCSISIMCCHYLSKSNQIRRIDLIQISLATLSRDEYLIFISCASDEKDIRATRETIAEEEGESV